MNCQSTSVQMSQQSSTWSPFSTPLFLESLMANPISSEQTNFQYSAFHSNSTDLSIGLNKSGVLTENKNCTNVIGSKPQKQAKYPKRSEQINLSDFIRQAEKQKALGGRAKLCTFCKTNGESAQIYTSHSLKDANDKITCPILLEYSCPVCGAAGEKSHTKKYCPKLQKQVRMQMLEKLSILANSNKEN